MCYVTISVKTLTLGVCSMFQFLIPSYVAAYMATHSVGEMLYNVGGLSHPSKMPEAGYSLPACACNVGQRLAQIARSVCAGCYANGGNYRFPNVEACLFDRLWTVANVPADDWILSMSGLIYHYGVRFFRWHDSGDLQSLEHFARIVSVCENTLAVTRHWLPTKEIGILKRWIGDRSASEMLPANLCVRVSSYYVGDDAPQICGLPTSTVSNPDNADLLCPVTYAPPGIKLTCDKAKCRGCWDRNLPTVDYKLHR